MPNTLVHFAAQGAASRGMWPRLDARWIYLGCLLPDVPWILRRAVVGLGIPVDVFDLRLYTMALASLAGAVLLCAALAVATAAPRLVLAVLGTNALLHLLLDATELKFGNGVHLAAPFSWRMASFDLLPGESPVYLVLAVAGLLLVTWELTRPRSAVVGFVSAPPRLAASAALLAAYFAFKGDATQQWRLFFTTGILGGFTTFSAFSRTWRPFARTDEHASRATRHAPPPAAGGVRGATG